MRALQSCLTEHEPPVGIWTGRSAVMPVHCSQDQQRHMVWLDRWRAGR